MEPQVIISMQEWKDLTKKETDWQELIAKSSTIDELKANLASQTWDIEWRGMKGKITRILEIYGEKK